MDGAGRWVRFTPMDQTSPARPAATTKPVDVDGVSTLAVGTALWAVALVVLLLLRDRLADNGTTWWLWTAVTGLGLGVGGLAYTRRRRDTIRRVREYRHDHPDVSGQNGRSDSVS